MLSRLPFFGQNNGFCQNKHSCQRGAIKIDWRSLNIAIFQVINFCSCLLQSKIFVAFWPRRCGPCWNRNVFSKLIHLKTCKHWWINIQIYNVRHFTIYLFKEKFLPSYKWVTRALFWNFMDIHLIASAAKNQCAQETS